MRNNQRNQVDLDLFREIDDFIHECDYEDLKSEMRHIKKQLLSSEISFATANLALCECLEDFSRRLTKDDA